MKPLKRIFIIESVFDDKNLHDAGELLEKQISPMCQDQGIELTRKTFYSLRECRKYIEQILNSSGTDGSTAIHLVCHGADDAFLEGLVYKIEPTYVPVAKQLNLNTNIMCHSWNALRADFVNINAKTNNNLFLSMCVCYGAKIFTDCSTAFARYTIASEGIMYLDDIKQPFVNIYMQIINSTGREELLKCVQEENAKMSKSKFSLYEGVEKIV